MLVHRAEVKVFVKQEDSYDSVKKALLSLFPFDLQQEKVNVLDESASGLDGNLIKILSVSLLKERQITRFLAALKQHLGTEQTRVLLEQKESRLDEHLFFFLRLEKASLLDSKYALTDSGNCFHIRMNIAAFPAKRASALETVKQLFS